MSFYVFEHAALFDGLGRERRPDHYVVVEDGVIRETGAGEASAASKAERIDCGGRTLMPGLIDAHVHIVATEVNLVGLDNVQKSLLHAQSRVILEQMLARGFTTVRDAGGADSGFAEAVEQGYIDGPRVFPSGAALSQTGGHADLRPRFGESYGAGYGCACCAMGSGGILGRIADGVPAVQQAARDELRKGATQIKVMASGGAASQTDPIENTQYSLAELRAIVDEAEAWRTYVMGHAYTPRAIIRAIESGVRSIEHGNLIDDTAAARMTELGAFLVPTLVSSDTLVRFGERFGSSPESMRKIRQVRDLGVTSVEIARRNGTKIGFGTDILGMQLHPHQGEEFMLRAQVEDPVDTLLSATRVNAEMMLQEGKLGVIAPGARADLLVLDGDPTRDASVFNQHGANLRVIMKDGKFYKRTLEEA